jgi:Ca2+-binding EF-hand superfamily protein
MSAEGLRRPIYLYAAATATLAVTYLVYHSYRSSIDDNTHLLHRSNAVRRPRRQTARSNLNASNNVTHADSNGTTRLDAALQTLATERNDEGISGHAVGFYQNPTLGASNLVLSPQTIEHVFNTVIEGHGVPVDDRIAFRQHIQAQYVHGLVSAHWGPLPVHESISAREMDVLSAALATQGLNASVVAAVMNAWNRSESDAFENWNPAQWFSVIEQYSMSNYESPNGGPADDTTSYGSPSVGMHDEPNEETGHNMLNLLYNIAGEQARKDGFVHRGVECNSCGSCPIQGIRYHCANCFDYDLCETCEANGVHIKTHVFYKVRIPAPSRGQIKSVMPKWYPGNPNAFPQTLDKDLAHQLKKGTGLDNPEIQGLYDQYKCLAGCELPSDPAGLCVAIDRKGFDQYFIPIPTDRPTPSNLIYDRIFAYYDANGDGCIDFVEFIKGITKLTDKSFMAKLQRMFNGYDLDGDGYVSRKDFLRMFRAYYDLSTQLNREMLYRNEDMDLHFHDELREVVQGTQPISAAFGGNMLFGHLSRPGVDKAEGVNGDLDIVGGPQGVLQNDLGMTGSRERAIGDVATGSRQRHHPFRSFREEPPQDEPLMYLSTQSNLELLAITHADDASEQEIAGPEPPFQTYGWPPLLTPEPQDIINALDRDLPMDEITDPVDRSRVFFAQSQRLDAESNGLDAHKRRIAVQDRWRRRQFYLDQEEGMQRPAGYAEPDSSEAEDSEDEGETVDSSRRHSLRSRSSSKVRFDDSAIDTDYETRSNASSKGMNQNERWGGYELSRPTLDIGADVLYEAVQQGLNELIDCLFKTKEDQALEAQGSRQQRKHWKDLLSEYATGRSNETDQTHDALVKADGLRTEALLRGPETFQMTLDPGLTEEGREVHSAIQEEINRAISDVKEASQLSRDTSRDPPRAPLESMERCDPTLPQFRPDASKPRSSHVSSSSESSLEEPVKPSSVTLEKWLLHERIDEEAKVRGGHGRLSFSEFRKLVELSSLRDNEKADGKGLGSAGLSRKAEQNIVAPKEESEADVEYWEKTGGLGKLAFLCTWLEMASF